ncbi:MAG: redoxin domain-containing protein [Planctomycetota bacterium]
MMARTFTVFSWFLVMASGGMAETLAPGKVVADFVLPDHRGAEKRLSELAGDRHVVLAFLGAECPLAKVYGQRLTKLAKEYADKGVVFVGIDSNSQDSLTDIAAYVNGTGITFPVLKDNNAVVADTLNATRTPEVFLLDQKRVLRYRGRIDDQFGIGYAREEATDRYLAAAIDEVLAGKAVSKETVDPVGCLIGRTRKATMNADVTYSKQIARIFQDRCVECHRKGEIGPFALTEYSEVAGWADMIDEVVQEKRMPPWHASDAHKKFKNDRSLTDQEKGLIHQWVAAGAPEGDPKDLPEPKTFVEGWSLPRNPDLILDVQQVPFEVPAEGVVDYKQFIVDPGFTEDKWITASQILPGAPEVVHHVLCFVMSPNQSQRGFLDGNGLGFLSAYVPGYRPTPLPKGMAKFVPKGSKLRFQMHYTPNGRAQKDLSKIAFVFADPSELTEMVQTVSAANPGLNIPPHASDYSRVAIASAYRSPVRLLALSPHMHLRGKSFLYELVYPDGKTEKILDVPRYDFNWQTNYELAEPLDVPPGAKVRCVAHWDNSSDNPANPDPSANVTWGDQSWDEMMLGFFDVAVKIDREQLAKEKVAPRLESAGTMEDRAKDMLASMDENGDGKVSMNELPQRFRAFTVLIDRNRDGGVDDTELLEFIKVMRERQGAGNDLRRFGGFGPQGERRRRPRREP